jgi:hypothetical protein
MKRHSLLLALSLAAVAHSEIKETVILTRPFRVVASYDSAGSRFDDITVTAQTAEGPVCYRTAAQDRDQAVLEAKAGTKISGPYVFLWSTCVDCNGWRGNGYLVFKAAHKVQYLGFLSSDFKATLPYSEGVFRNIYARLETNDLLSHSASPGFMLSLRDRGHGLQVDADRTWNENQAAIRNLDAWTHKSFKALGKDADVRDFVLAEHDLLKAAALARVCGRESRYAEILKLTRKIIPNEAFYAAFTRTAATVVALDPDLDNTETPCTPAP